MIIGRRGERRLRARSLGGAPADVEGNLAKFSLARRKRTEVSELATWLRACVMCLAVYRSSGTGPSYLIRRTRIRVPCERPDIEKVGSADMKANGYKGHEQAFVR